MTAAARAANDETAETTALEAEARALAEAQRDLQRAEAKLAPSLALSPSPIARALDRARKYLASTHSEDAKLQKTAEWFLDNYYLIRRAARQITQDLPPGFSMRLPQLAAGPAKGVARIDALARTLVSRSGIEIDVGALQSFVLAYQEVSPLTIAELWALPTMLRISVLHGLLHFLDELDVPVHGRLERAPVQRAPPDAAPDTIRTASPLVLTKTLIAGVGPVYATSTSPASRASIWLGPFRKTDGSIVALPATALANDPSATPIMAGA